MNNQNTAKNTLLFTTGLSPVASDVITTDNKVIVNPKAKVLEFKEYGNGSAGNSKTTTNDDFVTADFSVEVVAKPSGTAGTAPKYASLLKVCGLKEVITPGTSVVYTPELTNVTGNAKAYVDGEMREVSGISGNMTFGGQVGEFAKFNFSVKGFTTLVPTDEANPTVTLDANKNLLITSATAITSGGNSIALKSFEFSTGNDIQETYASSVKEYYIEDFKPTIKITAVKTKSNKTHWEELKANTLKEIIVVLGDGAGKQIELKASYCNPSDVSESDDSGKMTYEKNLLCQSDSGNDNFSITYK